MIRRLILFSLPLLCTVSLHAGGSIGDDTIKFSSATFDGVHATSVCVTYVQFHDGQVLYSSGVNAADWTRIQNIPADIADGDQVGEGGEVAGAVILLYADEVNGSTIAATFSGSSVTLKNWNLPANTYTTITVEADGDYWYFVDIATVAKTNWFIVQDGSKKKEVYNQLVGTAAGPGNDNAWNGRESVFVKTSFDGGQVTETNISFGVGVSAKRAAAGVRAQSFRVYGVK